MATKLKTFTQSILRSILAVKWALIPPAIALLFVMWWLFQPRLKNIEYTATHGDDGGYSINIEGDYRAEYIHEKTRFAVKLSGSGSDWAYRSQSGFYYSYDQIKVNGFPHADIGYAWVDKDKTHVYLNLFWVHYPDGIRPAIINGKYSLSPKT